MTAPAIGLTTRHPTVPFMTTGMYKREPTGMPVDQLVSGGSPQQQEQELAQIIARASQEMNTFCYGASGGVLSATIDTESLRIRLDRFGRFILTPRFTPVLALTGFQYGVDMAAMTVVTDLTHAEVEPDRIILPSFTFTGTSSAGPLQFGPVAAPNFEVRAVFSVANGFPLTQLTATATAGATSITVTDPTGIYPGAYLTLRDPVIGDESFTVTSVTGNVIAFTSTLANTHTVVAGQPIQVDALPGDLITSCTEMTTGMLKRRQNASANVSTNRHLSPSGQDPREPGEDNLSEAYSKLHPYIQTRVR